MRKIVLILLLSLVYTVGIPDGSDNINQIASHDQSINPLHEEHPEGT